MGQINIRLPDALHEDFRRACRLADDSMSDVFVQAVRQYLARPRVLDVLGQVRALHPQPDGSVVEEIIDGEKEGS